MVMNCYVCRKYLDRNDETVYKQTSFRCSLCLMPLCQEGRIDTSNDRNKTCFDEHMCTNDAEVSCNGEYYTGKKFPNDRQVHHHLRKTRRMPARDASGARKQQKQ